MGEPARKPEQPELTLDAPKRRRSDEYSDLFQAAKELYPKRDGANPWPDAWRQWKARLKEGESELEMLAGVKRYARWCEARGRVGTEFVMQAARFFGRSKHYLETYEAETKQGYVWAERPDPTIPRFTEPHPRHK